VRILREAFGGGSGGNGKKGLGIPVVEGQISHRREKVDVLVKDRNLLGLVANSREFLQEGDSGAEKDLRRATTTGRPLVDHEHLARIEEKIGRSLLKEKPGRKPPDSMK
jgi:hypothetical protein